ncbi:hypothetical protein SH580_13195 [Coraliomargarita algicola]|uniref:Lipoprotein n=1 Tax=Coraliomargarita algicola TaxID=3092156 RepID=A0ABZ0RGN1_9BACT|nr:hypothetical protein [Coraliomargarita sp. J2-16]WPJ94389.1 hypothetical protein SH580_13195 [Coraliomargarita sp. J2-16]
MNRFRISSLVVFLFSLLLLSFTGCSPKAEGTYEGFCENQTYGGKAQIILILKLDGNDVTGYINITGNLGGSAPINGLIEKDRISFSSDAGEGMPITWMGVIEGEQISGQYRVSANQRLKQQGVQDQAGIWAVRK